MPSSWSRSYGSGSSIFISDAASGARLSKGSTTQVAVRVATGGRSASCRRRSCSRSWGSRRRESQRYCGHHTVRAGRARLVAGQCDARAHPAAAPRRRPSSAVRLRTEQDSGGREAAGALVRPIFSGRGEGDLLAHAQAVPVIAPRHASTGSPNRAPARRRSDYRPSRSPAYARSTIFSFRSSAVI